MGSLRPRHRRPRYASDQARQSLGRRQHADHPARKSAPFARRPHGHAGRQAEADAHRILARVSARPFHAGRAPPTGLRLPQFPAPGLNARARRSDRTRRWRLGLVWRRLRKSESPAEASRLRQEPGQRRPGRGVSPSAQLTAGHQPAGALSATRSSVAGQPHRELRSRAGRHESDSGHVARRGAGHSSGPARQGPGGRAGQFFRKKGDRLGAQRAGQSVGRRGLSPVRPARSDGQGYPRPRRHRCHHRHAQAPRRARVRRRQRHLRRAAAATRGGRPSDL